MSEPTIYLHHARMRPTTASSRRERRNGSRTPVAYVQCWSPAPGTILNISRMGLGIESFRSFKRGDSVFLTSELAGRSERILGHVRWCRQIATAGGSSSPVYQVGIALAKPLGKRWLSALPKRESLGLTGRAAADAQ